MRMRDYKRKKKRKKKKGLVLATVLFTLVLGGLIVLNLFTVKSIAVEGNVYYTEKEISEILMQDLSMDNSLLLLWKIGRGEIEIPFIHTLEADMPSPGTLNVRVYEKNIVGFIEYLNSNMYFDEDGIVVEGSDEVLDDIPQISGLEFKSLALHQPLEVENEKVFDTILNLTRLLKKAGIAPDRIYFDSQLEMILYFDEVKVLLGQDLNLEAKISRLYSLLPELEGMAGTLYMENFTTGTKNITFKKEDDPVDQENGDENNPENEGENNPDGENTSEGQASGAGDEDSYTDYDDGYSDYENDYSDYNDSYSDYSDDYSDYDEDSWENWENDGGGYSDEDWGGDSW